MEKHIIDLGADPFLPDTNDGGCSRHHVDSDNHIRGDASFLWHPSKVRLVQPERLMRSRSMSGYDFRAMPLRHCNANLLDYLLDHQDLIPEEWQDKIMIFYGTIYCKQDIEPYGMGFHHLHQRVRCLQFDGRRWMYVWANPNEMFGWICYAAVFDK